MLHVGVIDNDDALITAMTELWKPQIEVRTVDHSTPNVEDLDVLIADPSALEGHVLSFLHGIHRRAPRLKLVLAYVYCDTTQPIEEKLFRVADACVLKPCDLRKLEKTLLHVVARGTGDALERPSST